MLGTSRPAETGGCAGALERAVGLGELAAEDSAAVEGRCRQEVYRAQEEVDPDCRAEEARGGDPGALQEIDLGGDGQDHCAKKEAEADVGDGADDGHALLHRGGAGQVGRLGGCVAHEAAKGQQEQAAELQPEPGGGDGARYLADDHSHQKQEPQRKAATARHAGD
jgi:hypothetical protein